MYAHKNQTNVNDTLIQFGSGHDSVGNKLPRPELQTVLLVFVTTSCTTTVLRHGDLPVSRCARIWISHVCGAVVAPDIVQLVE